MQADILVEIRRTNEPLEWVLYLLAVLVLVRVARSAILVAQNWKRINQESLKKGAKELNLRRRYHELFKLCAK